MKRIFKDIKNNKGETYSVVLTFDDEGNLLLDKSSCTCIFGSFYRFAGFWKKKKTICRHMIQGLNEVKKEIN